MGSLKESLSGWCERVKGHQRAMKIIKQLDDQLVHEAYPLVSLTSHPEFPLRAIMNINLVKLPSGCSM